MLDMYLQREDAYNENRTKLFAVIYGQCTPQMIAGLKSQDGFKDKETMKDVVWLMKAVNKLSVGINEHENEAVTARRKIMAKNFFVSIRWRKRSYFMSTNY